MDMANAIRAFDPKIQVRAFPSLESLFNWTKLLLEVGPSAVSRGGLEIEGHVADLGMESGTDRLALLVIKSEFLGAQNLGLIKKIQQALVQNKVCTIEDPTSIVLTAFDKPEFVLKDLENRIINNVIFKPFDPLILIQHLTFAIDGRHPPSKYTIANQKADATLEIIKDIDLEMLSDIGFVTASDSALEVGSAAKYYSKYFSTERERSVIAVCIASLPHPTKANKFQCWFTYFGANTAQKQSLRRVLQSESEFTEHTWTALSTGRSDLDNVQVISLVPEESEPGGLITQLSERFKNCYTTSYKSLDALLHDLDPTSQIDDRPADWKICSLGSPFEMIFDKTGSLFVGLVQDQKSSATLFGHSEASLKARGAWFSSALDTDSKNKFRKIVREGIKDLAEDLTLSLTLDGSEYLVRAANVDIQEKRILVKFYELSKQEEIDWYRKHSNLPDKVDILLLSEKFLSEQPEKRIQDLREKLAKRTQGKPAIFIISQTVHSDSEKRDLAKIVDDILYRPVERIYFWHRLQSMFPKLRGKDTVSGSQIVAKSEILKVAMPVKVTEISEAGFIMEYHRAVEIGSFREVILWQPYEIDSQEIIASCNYTEVSESNSKVYLNHFIFFGPTDSLLKLIRIWIRDNYILSKKGEE